MAGCAARVPPGSEARLSLATFLLGASVLALPLLTRAGLQGRTGLALYVAGLNALLLLLYRPPRYQVRAGCGGTGTGIGDGRAGRVNRDRGQVDWDQGREGWRSGPGTGRVGRGDWLTRTRDRVRRIGWTGRPAPQTWTSDRVDW